MSPIGSIELRVDQPYAYLYLEELFKENHISYFNSVSGVMSFQNDYDRTHKLLLKESTEYPNAKISVSMRRRFDIYQLKYLLEYNNGSYRLIDALLEYNVTFDRGIRSLSEDIQNDIYDKVLEIYRRIDRVKVFEKGNLQVDVNADKTITVELNIADHSIKTVKTGQDVNIYLVE